MSELAVYQPGDVQRLQLTPDSCLALGGHPVEVLEGALGHWQEDAVTLVHASRALACWGLILPWPGLAEAWCVVDSLVVETPACFYRPVRAWLYQQCQARALRRVQCHILVGHQAGERLAHHLGFQTEAVLNDYGPQGEPMWLMALLRRTGGW